MGDAAGETDAPAVAAANAIAAEEMLDRLRDDLCDVTTTPGAGEGGDELGLRLKVGERSTSRGLVLPKSLLFLSHMSVLLDLKRAKGLFGVCGDFRTGVRGGVRGDDLGEVLGETEGGLGDKTASNTVSYRPPGFRFIVILCSKGGFVLLGVPTNTSCLEHPDAESRELALSQENSLQNPVKPSGGEFEMGLVAGVTVTPTVLMMFSESLYCISIDGFSITVSFVSDCPSDGLNADPAGDPFRLESRFFIFGGESSFKTGTFSESLSGTLKAVLVLSC